MLHSQLSLYHTNWPVADPSHIHAHILYKLQDETKCILWSLPYLVEWINMLANLLHDTFTDVPTSIYSLIIMLQSVKLTGAIWLLQLVIFSPLIRALVWTGVKSSQWFKPGSPAWEADDLPTELSLPPSISY